VEPGEHVLDDVLGGRPVPDQHHRQPDEFRVVKAEERGDVHGRPAHGKIPCGLGTPGTTTTVAAFTAKRIAHNYGTHPSRVWLPSLC